ncbi:shikimate kinase [Streptomyces inusitatus]|uniref:Shikimate kinase n=1 Tax=Streptomyces inusitatus TaxID=68221 RepID=A0A918V315_9ACTN|nr:shikimate kinase [Streptomyces inusitatus]GGZ65162.1 shikimate kinase [Streptomyces inusitatus]
MTAPAVVLIGAPGSGKTTVGTLLAERLGVGFRDTDQDVEHGCGMSVAELVRLRGEAPFRELERIAVRTALDEHDGVLALGGGAVLDPSTQRLLAAHRVVHLSTDPATALARIGGAASRPLLADDPERGLRELFRVRGPLYRRLATLTVDSAGTPAQAALRLALALETTGAAT